MEAYKVETQTFWRGPIAVNLKVVYDTTVMDLEFVVKSDGVPLAEREFVLTWGNKESETKVSDSKGWVFFYDKPLAVCDFSVADSRLKLVQIVPPSLVPSSAVTPKAGKARDNVSDNLSSAEVLIKNRQYDEAIKVLKKSLQKNPDGIDVYIQLIRAYSLAGCSKEAFQTVNTAIRKAKSKGMPSAIFFRQRAGFYLRRGKFKAALKDCQRAIKLCPADSGNWAFMILIYRRLKNVEKAYKTYEDFSRYRRAVEVDVALYYVLKKSGRRRLGKIFLYGLTVSLKSEDIDALCRELEIAGLDAEYEMIRRIVSDREL